MTFKIDHIKEPLLMFANEGCSYDPRIGLLKYGPRTPSDVKTIDMKIGLIGSSQTIGEMQNILKQMRNRIFPKVKKLQKWSIPFPGLNEFSPLKITINLQKRWRQILTTPDINEIVGKNTKEDRIESFLNLIYKKLLIIYGKETPPDVVIICIPEEIYEKCVSPSSIKEKMRTSYSDFHSRVKIQGIKLKLPTQIIHPYTLRGHMTQDLADIAWNLTVGLLYKSQKGHPWKLAELEENTCYAGISFYKVRGEEGHITEAAMAQVFLDTGESFILRADTVEQIQGRQQNHLSEIDASNVIRKILRQYEENRGGSTPERLVIHKTSNFWEEEKAGMVEAASQIHRLDLVTLHENHPIRLFSSCDFPVLRGTLLTPPDRSEHYLYTTGYIPVLGTYPGHRIPRPIVVKPDADYCSTPIYELCEEILAFTKLDWNSSHFCKKNPVTIEISRSVGHILADSQAQDAEVDPHYYYYM